MSWNDIAARTVEAVIRENPGTELKALRKMISEAYPFGERKYWPYKCWCRQVKIALRDKEFREKMGEKMLDNLPLFPVSMGDCPGGPLDRDGVELDEPEKGHCFDEMWGLTKGG